LILPACKTAPKKEIKTIIPERVVDVQPSWDEDKQNSGIIGSVEGKGFEITAAALARYNALIAIYGPTSVPQIVKDHGVSIEGERIYISPEALVHWMVMNSQYKNGIKP
jgi:hypothetical protein